MIIGIAGLCIRKYLLNVGSFRGPYETRSVRHQEVITNPINRDSTLTYY